MINKFPIFGGCLAPDIVVTNLVIISIIIKLVGSQEFIITPSIWGVLE
jgi:hypothetical protein